jgi:hypothetical protein
MRGISRRDVLKNLAVGAAGGSVLQMIPAEAAALAHQMVHQEKSASAAGKYTPKFFSPRASTQPSATLCDTIIPKDETSGGAVEAGAPEFIDLLCSENEEFQLANRRRPELAGQRLPRPLRTHFSRVHPRPEKRNPRFARLPQKCQERSVTQPRESCSSPAFAR